MTVIINGTTGVTSVNGSAAAPSVTGTDTDTGIVYGTNTITLATGGTAGLYQDAGQNIGIGGTTPSAWTSGATALQVGSQYGLSAYGHTRNAYYDGSTYRYIAAGYKATLYQGGDSHVWYTTNSTTGAGNAISFTQSMTLNSSSNLLLVGGMALGNVSYTDGIGVKFPAAQVASSNANTLDDYEEGTWTPQLGSSGASPTVTYLNQSGTFTKIGNVVTITFDVQWTLGSTGSGTLAVTGLPFAVAGTRGAMMFGYAIAGTTAWQGGYGANGNTFIWVTYRGTNTGSTEAPATLLASGQFIGQMTYYTS